MTTLELVLSKISLLSLYNCWVQILHEDSVIYSIVWPSRQEQIEPLWMGSEPDSPDSYYPRMWRSYYMLLEVLRTASDNRDGVGLPQGHLSCSTKVQDPWGQLLLSVWFSEVLQTPTFAAEAIALNKYLFTVESDTISPLTNKHFSIWPPAPHWSCYFELAFPLRFITYQVCHYKVNSLIHYSVIKYHSHLIKVNSFFLSIASKKWNY